jgi:tight adherence protein B
MTYLFLEGDKQMLELISLLLFLTLAIVFYVSSKFLIGKQGPISRLKRYIDIEEVKRERKKASTREYKAGLGIIARGIGNAKFLESYKRSTQLQLTRAHILLKAEEYITICIILFFVLSLLTFAVTTSSLCAVVVGTVGWFIPSIVVKSKIKRRIKYLNEQLSDAIVLISNSLKAGYSFFQATDILAREMTGPISEEFTSLQKEINLGVTTEKALENLVERVASDDLELVITAVLIERQVGGNLSEILDNISSTIRERVKIKGEVKTVTAQGRLSGWIISLLPPGLGVILYLMNPKQMSVLFTDPMGIAIVVFSVMMELIGIYIISKIVKVEV